MEMVQKRQDGAGSIGGRCVVDGGVDGSCAVADLQGILGRLGYGWTGSSHLFTLRTQIFSNMAKKITYPKEVTKPVEKHLVEKLSTLEKKKKDLHKEDPFSDASRLDDNAAVDADAAEQFGHMRVNAVKKTIDRSIIQIRKALSRIKVGKYGVCERCGKFIDTDRLMILPETTLCVGCEKKRER